MQSHQRIAVRHAVRVSSAAGSKRISESIITLPTRCIFSGGDAFPLEVDVAIFRRGEQKVRQLIGYQSIDFFRHAAVERAQSRFHVPHL